MARNLKSIADKAKDGPLSESQLRWIRFCESTNGAKDCEVFKQIGRRVYVDVDAFDRWIDAQQQRPQAQAGAA